MEGQFYRWLAWHGLADLVIVLVLAIVLSFVFDFVFELPWILRLVILAVTGLWWARVLIRGKRRSKVQLTSGDLLATVEGSSPELEGQLVNVVELRKSTDGNGSEPDATAEPEPPPTPLEAELLKRARQEAQRVLSRVQVEGSLDTRYVKRRVSAAVGGGIALISLAAAFPSLFSVWAERNVLLSSKRWPRETHFSIEQEAPVWHHPRKAPLRISAWVVGKIPRDVFIHVIAGDDERRIRLAPGQKLRSQFAIHSVVSDGAPAPGETVDAGQVVHAIGKVVDSFDFYLSAGDNRSRTIRVEVHDRPRVVETKLRIQPPRHTGQKERVISNPAGEIRAVIGSKISVQSRCDRALESAWVRFGREGRQDVDEVAGDRFSHSMTLDTSGFLEFGFRGASWGFDGKSRRLALVAEPDRIPEIDLAVTSDSRYVTTKGKIEYDVEARDDFGFRSVRLEVTHEFESREDVVDDDSESEEIDGEESGDDTAESSSKPTVKVIELDLAGAVREEDELVVRDTGVLDLAAFELDPPIRIGDRLRLQAVAVDNDEPAGGKVGSSDEYVFQVISSEALERQMEKIRVAAQERIEELTFLEGQILDEIARLGEPGAQANQQNAQNSQSSQANQQNAQNSQSSQANQQNAQNSQSSQANQDSRPPRSAEALAREQQRIAEEAREISQQLREMAETLQRNELMNDAETRRFENEVTSPLDDLGEDRLPRNARDIEQIPQSDEPREQIRRVQADAERLEKQLENVAKSLAGSGDFREILQRLDSLIELHKDVIDETRGGVQAAQGQE